jgi:hypothetical protein
MQTHSCYSGERRGWYWHEIAAILIWIEASKRDITKIKAGAKNVGGWLFEKTMSYYSATESKRGWRVACRSALIQSEIQHTQPHLLIRRDDTGDETYNKDCCVEVKPPLKVKETM